ncbi:MAG: hypothetical protein IPM56_09945 [Ignavibacteriales bacterium]|nr:MAG: hypothetical protein IPM56_09945 [Ignavibacteriales bacterium]
MKIEHSTKSKIRTGMKRTKFFTSLGAGVISFFALKNLPLNFLKSQIPVSKNDIKININPSAVVRNKSGVKND